MMEAAEANDWRRAYPSPSASGVACHKEDASRRGRRKEDGACIPIHKSARALGDSSVPSPSTPAPLGRRAPAPYAYSPAAYAFRFRAPDLFFPFPFPFAGSSFGATILDDPIFSRRFRLSFPFPPPPFPAAFEDVDPGPGRPPPAPPRRVFSRLRIGRGGVLLSGRWHTRRPDFRLSLSLSISISSAAFPRGVRGRAPALAPAPARRGRRGLAPPRRVFSRLRIDPNRERSLESRLNSARYILSDTGPRRIPPRRRSTSGDASPPLPPP